MAVVREGVLQLGKDPNSTSPRDWKSYLFVLKHNPEKKKSTLDYYKDQNKRWQKQDRKGSMELFPFFHLSLAHNCSYRYPFKITDVTQKVYYLAASSFEVMNKWYNSLQMQSYLVPSNQDSYREFIVHPVKSVSTSLIGAMGQCMLAFTPQNQMVCALLPSLQMVGVWPYNSLRTYWGGKEQFGFRAGRRSPRGEGEFVFVTKKGEEIYQFLQRTIRLTSMASKTQLENSLPPDPTRAETPVPCSDSDEERQPPPQEECSPPAIPSKPPELLKQLEGLPTPPLMHQVMPTGSGGIQGTEVSETSPAYLVRTAGMKRHHQTPRAGAAGQEPPPHVARKKPPLVPSQSLPVFASSVPVPEDDDDNTYSHATRQLPQHFIRNASLKIIEGETLYHGLVRTDSTKSAGRKPAYTGRVKLKQPGDTEPGTEGAMTGAESQPDDQLYDLAYPPTFQQCRVLTPVHEGDYGSVGDPEMQKKMIMEKKLLSSSGKMLSDDKLPFGAQLRAAAAGWDGVDGGGSRTVEGGGGKRLESFGRQTSDDLMTANPLYGDNALMTSLVDVERSPDLSDSRRDGVHVSTVDVGLDSLVTNPVYGEHMPLKWPSRSTVHGVEVGGAPEDTAAARRPASPFEHSIVANPLYGERKDLGGVGGDRPKEARATEEEPGDGTGESKLTLGSNGESKKIQVPGGEGGDCGLVGNEGRSHNLKRQTYSEGIEEGGCDENEARPISAPKDSHNSRVKNSNIHDHNIMLTQSPQTADVNLDDSKLVASTVSEDAQSAEDTSGRLKELSPPPNVEAREASTSPQNKPHGYSKVDKKKNSNSVTNKQQEQEGDESPPPPIPPRKYSNSSDS